MELAELAVKKALGMGATEAEAYLQRAETIRVEFAEEIESFKTIDSMGISLRVALGRKIAIYSTSILDESEISEAAAKALKIAQVAPEDPEWRRLNSRFGEAPAEGYRDDALETLDYGEIVEKISSATALVKDHDKRVRPTRGLLALVKSRTSMANSYGESCEREETHVAAWMRAKAKEAGMESTGAEHQQVRFWGEVDLKELAVRAAEKAVTFLRARPIPSRKTSVIFRNQVFASILGVMLSGPVNADWVQKGRSPLANKLGEQIASTNISIIDDGLMHGGWGTRPFDDEGHPTQRTPVVERGVLKSYLYDTYTALKDDVESTGNARRPYYWMAPQPSPSNLILKPGEAALEEIIQETRQGVYVEETIGEWLSNPVSGELNATVTHGYLVEDGELSDPIKGVVISGNFYELLRDGVEMVGRDLRNNMQNYSPTIKAAQLTIAGE